MEHEPIGMTAFALAQGTLAILLKTGTISYAAAYEMLDERIAAHEAMDDPIQGEGVAGMLRMVRQATEELEAGKDAGPKYW